MRQVIVDSQAAALHYGISAAVIRQWLHRGHLTHHGHHGRRALVDLVEIDAILAARDEAA